MKICKKTDKQIQKVCVSENGKVFNKHSYKMNLEYSKISCLLWSKSSEDRLLLTTYHSKAVKRHEEIAKDEKEQKLKNNMFLEHVNNKTSQMYVRDPRPIETLGAEKTFPINIKQEIFIRTKTERRHKY